MDWHVLAPTHTTLRRAPETFIYLHAPSVHDSASPAYDMPSQAFNPAHVSPLVPVKPVMPLHAVLPVHVREHAASSVAHGKCRPAHAPVLPSQASVSPPHAKFIRAHASVVPRHLRLHVAAPGVV